MMLIHVELDSLRPVLMPLIESSSQLYRKGETEGCENLTRSHTVELKFCMFVACLDHDPKYEAFW